MTEFQSWGRLHRTQHEIVRLQHRHDTPKFDPGKSYLAYGMGRSYGDSCLNDGGVLLHTRGLDRFIAFDPQTGILDCEAGVTLEEITALVLPQGWFPAVTPGTQFVTVGGAIANDVHGKNHHRAGSFGCHVLDLELLRSDGSRHDCSPAQNTDLFAATIGGLGLTGLILRARLQLRRVSGPWIAGETLRFATLDEFFSISAESDHSHEYTVAWVDCFSRAGRGLFMRGNHAATEHASPRHRTIRAPFTPPVSLVSNLSVKIFNAVYYHQTLKSGPAQLWHYKPFFYPLDSLLYWNRLYGPRGFFQYQCVLPAAVARDAVHELLGTIAASGQGSMLAVLKMFGPQPSTGPLSFPRPGVTLALDFPNGGDRTLKLLDRLDAITRAGGGAVYPAKDARMGAEAFHEYFPRMAEFARWRDPAFSSSFSRRTGLT